MTLSGPLLHILRLVLLVLLQVLILNQIDLGRFAYPMIYVMAIVLLPFEWPVWLLMITGFALGFCVDAFTSTLGMHISAAVLLAGVRPIVMRLLEPRDGYEFGTGPGIMNMGLRWFASYCGILIFIHHLAFFLVEKFHFSGLGYTLLQALLSTVTTFALAVLLQYLFNNIQSR